MSIASNTFCPYKAAYCKFILWCEIHLKYMYCPDLVQMGCQAKGVVTITAVWLFLPLQLFFPFLYFSPSHL